MSDQQLKKQRRNECCSKSEPEQKQEEEEDKVPVKATVVAAKKRNRLTLHGLNRRCENVILHSASYRSVPSAKATAATVIVSVSPKQQKKAACVPVTKKPSPKRKNDKWLDDRHCFADLHFDGDSNDDSDNDSVPQQH